MHVQMRFVTWSPRARPALKFLNLPQQAARDQLVVNTSVREPPPTPYRGNLDQTSLHYTALDLAHDPAGG